MLGFCVRVPKPRRVVQLISQHHFQDSPGLQCRPDETSASAWCGRSREHLQYCVKCYSNGTVPNMVHNVVRFHS
jgi:hypothetical protein